MNKPIRALAVACLAMFVALLVNINYVQFVQADDLNDKPNNRRVINEEFSRNRGPILVGEESVALSEPSDDRFEYQRTYPQGGLYAHLTGYFSYIYGNGGLERTENPILSGSDNRLFVNRVVDLISNKKPAGGSIELTIDPLAQKTAGEGLAALGKGTKGAVAAIDPDTGAILAMVSQPTYDPNRLASHNMGNVGKAMRSLQANADKPLTNRATQQILPPGSTFKLVTAAAALESDVVDGKDSKVRGGSRLTFPGMDYSLPNESGGNCGGATLTLQRAMQISCNVAFADLARKVGEEDLRKQAEAFGFGADTFEDLPFSPSQFTTQQTELDAPQLAQSGIGQFEVAATPLQMAMVAGAVVNDGVVMRPQLVKTVRSPSIRVLDELDPRRYGQAMSESTASALADMMVATAQNGTATSSQISGVRVGGKTGTAQSTPERPPYAWFVSFAEKEDQRVAVAVVVESSSTARSEIAGGRLAGPIAKSVMEAVLRK